MGELVPLRADAQAERWLTLGEISEYLRLSDRSVRRLIAEEGLPASRVGSRLRFRRSRVDEWMRRQEAS